MIGVELRTSKQTDRAKALVRLTDDEEICYLDKDRIGTRYFIFYGSDRWTDWVSNGKGELPYVFDVQQTMEDVEALLQKAQEFVQKERKLRVKIDDVDGWFSLWNVQQVIGWCKMTMYLLETSRRKRHDVIVAQAYYLEAKEAEDLLEEKRKEKEKKHGNERP